MCEINYEVLFTALMATLPMFASVLLQRSKLFPAIAAGVFMIATYFGILVIFT